MKRFLQREVRDKKIGEAYSSKGAYEGDWMSFEMLPRKKSFSHKGRIKEITNMYLADQ